MKKARNVSIEGPFPKEFMASSLLRDRMLERERERERERGQDANWFIQQVIKSDHHHTRLAAGIVDVVVVIMLLLLASERLRPSEANAQPEPNGCPSSATAMITTLKVNTNNDLTTTMISSADS